MMIAFSAALDNRRDINLAVFSRRAIRSASYSALAVAPSKAFCLFFLTLASARARTLSELLVNRISFSHSQRAGHHREMVFYAEQNKMPTHSRSTSSIPQFRRVSSLGLGLDGWAFVRSTFDIDSD
jgi:hypothetical protein